MSPKETKLLNLAIAIALFLRAIVDGAEYGFSVAIFLFLVLLILIFKQTKINKKALLVIFPIILFSAWGYIVAVYYHNEPFFALRGVVRYSSYAMIFLLSYYSTINIKSLYNIYTLVVTVQILVSIYEKIVLGIPRPRGTLINNNHINYLLIPYFSLTFLYYKNYIRSFLILIYTLFLGGLGGSILVFFIGSINLFYKTKGKMQLLAGIMLIPLFLFLFSVMLSERIEEQKAGLTQLEVRLESGKGGGGAGSLVWRIVTWKLMIEELIDKKGLLFGQGIDYASLSSPYFLTASIREPHNDYVRNLLEFGIVGLIFYLLMYFRYTLFFFKLRNTSLFAYSMFYSLIALAIGQISGNIIAQSTLWWFVFALSGAYFRYHIKKIYI